MSSDTEYTPDNSLAKALGQPAVQELASTVAELALDSILKDGVLKEVPIISTLTAVAKLGVTVHDNMLLRKLYRFGLPLL